MLVENASAPSDKRVWPESLALRDAGYDVVVVSPKRETRDSESETVVSAIPIHRFPVREAAGGPLSYLREYSGALWHLSRLAWTLDRRHRFDVVHAANPPDFLVLAALPLKLRGARFVFDHHDVFPEMVVSQFGPGLFHRLTLWLERLTFRVADAVISTNESYRQVAIQRGGLPPERVTVVRNAPDPARVVRVAADPALRRGKRHLLVYVGIMGVHDGVHHAVEALAHLRHALGRDDFHAAFVGQGAQWDDLVQLARSLDLDDCVEFTGRISDEALMRYFSTADIGLAPDPLDPANDISTMIKILEYMAMGIPIVSFDLREARVSAQGAAAYAPPNDAAAYAQLISDLLDDPDRRREMGEAGKRRIEGPLSWETSRRALLDAYDRLLAAPGGRRRSRRPVR
jgi:glycosyltransferase involved in cell wall biosynthesis